MAAKRSPILGYNHNVRYRGIVFHVQTEDSGIVNPHVFTHLFHGGVILTTRKLVYDPDATEDTVKSLMQAQHKAVMKDLKNLAFDDKIDVYLVGTPGLLPRGHGVDVVPAVEETPPPRPIAPRVETQDPTPPASPPPRAPSAAPIEIDVSPTVPVSMEPGEALGRAPTERVSADHIAVIEAELPPSTGTPPLIARADISAAMASIQVGDDELAAAGLVEIADVAEVHSPAPPSTPTPPGVPGVPGERPGQYSVTRKSGPMETLPRAPIPSPQPIPRPTPTGGNRMPVPGPPSMRPPTAPMPPRTQTPMTPPTPPRTATPGMVPRPGAPAVPRLDPARPPTSPQPPRPGVTPPPAGPPRGRPGTGGGVVVSRPPVIVGGPSKSVGSPTGQGKVRRAKETDGGIGGDLISERSLDEVILAYLSEDTTDE